MIIHGFLMFAMLAGSLLSSQPGQQGPVLTRTAIWQLISAELRQQGIPEKKLPSLDDIELPFAIPAAPAHTLRLANTCWEERLHRAEMRIECGGRGECLPFFVYVRMQRDAMAACAQRSQPGKARAQRPAVRSGDRLLVVFRGRGFVLSQRVTCLEHGREGQFIRVRNEDGHIFRARVAGPAQLEAVAR